MLAAEPIPWVARSPPRGWPGGLGGNDETAGRSGPLTQGGARVRFARSLPKRPDEPGCPVSGERQESADRLGDRRVDRAAPVPQRVGGGHDNGDPHERECGDAIGRQRFVEDQHAEQELQYRG